MAVWGLTFKAGTDDLRESPAISVLQSLASDGDLTIRAYDPAVPGAIDGLDVEVVSDPYAAVEGADVLAVLTEWGEFRSYDLDKVAETIGHRTVVDARNLLDRSALVRRGFTHIGMGR